MNTAASNNLDIAFFISKVLVNNYSKVSSIIHCKRSMQQNNTAKVVIVRYKSKKKSPVFGANTGLFLNMMIILLSCGCFSFGNGSFNSG